MNESKARELMVQVCRLGWQKGYLAGLDGNLSLRLREDRLLITPSGRSKALLLPEDLLVVDQSGRVLAGAGRPSSELALHLMAYRVRPGAKAAVHAHPPLLTAFSVARRELDLACLPELLVVLGQVPEAPYATPGLGGDDGLARAVEPCLAGHDAVILAHHGALCLGESLELAFARLEKLESAARVLLAAQTLGGAHPLPAEEQARLLALGGHPAAPEPLPPLAGRIELRELPLTSEFLVEKRWRDARGEAHLIVDGRPLRRVACLTLAPGSGHRGGHWHQRKHEGFYVVQGQARVELACVRSGERLALTLSAGSRLWLPPGVAHRITALADLCFVEFTDRAYEAEDDRPFAF